MLRIAVFCEARADFTIATDLVERVLYEDGPLWLREHVDALRWDGLRAWVGADGNGFFKIGALNQEVERRSILRASNRFAGKRGDAHALVAQNALRIARDEARRSGTIEAIVFVWDVDDHGDARRDGPAQARKDALLPMIIGCPDLEREAWVLAGFVPKNRDEHALLEEELKALSFDPVRRAHDLRDKKDHEHRSPKRVVKKLTGGDWERESLCWTETPLATLRKNGEESGLRAYLDEVRAHLLPLFSRG